MHCFKVNKQFRRYPALRYRTACLIFS